MTEERPSLSRFKDLISAYGADPAHWPDDERGGALALVNRDPLAAAMLEDERQLDLKLAFAEPVCASSELVERILVEAESSKTGWRDVLWPFGPLWQPMTAVACAGILGIVFGLLTAPGELAGDLRLAIEHVMLEL